MFGYNEVLIASAATAYMFCLVAAVAAAIWKIRTIRERWEMEGAICVCTHDYWDHIHHTNESPCARLMCSCQKWRGRKENP